VVEEVWIDRAKNVKIRVGCISTKPVAEIPLETIAKILELLGKLSILIDRASAAELSIFNTYGETEEIVDVLNQLQNTKERGVEAYTRLSGLMLKISRFQPSAPMAMVEMLEKSIEISEATVDAGEATVTEAKNDWNIS
jgi:hypothetical protein